MRSYRGAGRHPVGYRQKDFTFTCMFTLWGDESRSYSLPLPNDQLPNELTLSLTVLIAA